MPNILTPLSLWNNFDASLETNAECISSYENDGMRFDSVRFFGRAVGEERVSVAAVFASDAQTPATQTVIIFPDSDKTIDEETLKFFVSRGYSALMVDYRGEWEGCQFFTFYPKEISYANTASCGRYKNYVDDSAAKTCWYEWVSVGLYARKYAFERTNSDEIAVVGVRDGGEIAWKLGVAGKFECIIPVCSAGWKAYNGLSKYLSEEPSLDEERYRFIAGIDSQAYAPYVKCPVLMLCSTNDPAFDYDRAYDTFSRINAEYQKDSAISFSIDCNAGISSGGVNDMFLMLAKCLKNRQVFVPRPAEIFVEVDEESNLIARTVFDEKGVVESCGVYLAEDCMDSSLREWRVCKPKKSDSGLAREYYLNIFEKTTTIFVMASVKYSNGFSVWSKIVVKKISGKFRNMKTSSRVIFTDKDGTDGFTVADFENCSVGGVFLKDDSCLPAVVEKARGVKGLYSQYGLSTYRLCNARFAPSAGNLLSADVFSDQNATVRVAVTDVSSGEEYATTVAVVGGAWQNVIFESKIFKSANGASLNDFSGELKLTVTCDSQFAVNNIMWL